MGALPLPSSQREKPYRPAPPPARRRSHTVAPAATLKPGRHAPPLEEQWRCSDGVLAFRASWSPGLL